MSTHSPQRARLVAAFAVLAGSVVVPISAAGAAPGTTERVNVPWSGAQSAGPAALPAISSDGRIVAFTSSAGDLAPWSSGEELYAKDREVGSVHVVPQRLAPGPADGLTGQHDIDGDGSRVVFDADSANVSQMSDSATCDDGGVQVNCPDVFLKDIYDGKATKVSISWLGDEGDGRSEHGRISDDGRKVVFASDSTNLRGDDAGGDWDIFVRQLLVDPGDDEEDIDRGTTLRLTATEPGSITGEPVISADGSTVAFWSTSTTLVPGVPSGVNLFVAAAQHAPSVSWVAHLDATVALDSYSPTLSGDGQLVGFMTRDSLVEQDTNSDPDLYVRDRLTPQLTLIGWNGAGARAAAPDGLELSDEGGHALFRGGAGLVAGTPAGRRYVYVQDLASGTSRVGSLADDGTVLEADAATGPRSLSPDGSTVVFSTAASNAVADDTNDAEDVFLRVLGDLEPLPPLGEPGDLDTTLDGSGEELRTGDDATPEVPVIVSVAPPADLVGTLTIDLEESDPSEAPTGYSVFGSQLTIEGPASTYDQPYVVTFEVDASELGAVAPTDVQVFRDGVVVGDCTDPEDAVPDPCVEGRSETAGGDAAITVRTSHFSEWVVGALDYAVEGPFAPVDAFPTVNIVKAGSAVPVKFRLGGARGLDVFTDGSPDTEVVACGGSTDAIEQTIAAPGGALTYDASTTTYTYVWKSARGATGCRDLVLRFRDGSELTARFQLR